MSDLSILLLDTEPRTHNRYLVLAIADALRRHPAVGRVHVGGHGDAVATFVEQGFDTLIAFGGARAQAPLVGRLAGLARTSVLWTTEDPYERAANVRGSAAFDLVFTNDRATVPAYGGRAHHLPLGASSLFHDLAVIEDDARYRYDLLFIGTAWPNRVATLNALSAKLPRDVKFKLALPWNEHIGPPELADDALVTDWRCGNRDFALLANRSRVVLTLPRIFSSARADQATGSTPPPRLFETALAGGYQVVVSPEPETAAYYAPGAQIALCGDEAGAVEAILTALTDPEARIARARAAQARTRAEHLYDHRVATILDAVSDHRRTPARRPHQAPAAIRTVLMLTHNRIGHRPGGGVEVYQELLTELGEPYRILFLFPVFGDGRWSLRLEGPGIAESFACGPVTPPLSTDPFVEALFQRLLFEHQVDLVHIHHLMHVPLSLPLIARACGIPTVYHLHDHFLICERWLLLDHTGRFCDVVNRGADQCDACLVSGNNYPPGSKARRDGMMTLVTDAIDAFVTSTPETARYLRRYFPGIPAERIVEIPMVAPSAAPAEARSVARRKRDADRLTVAILGNLAAHKGGQQAINLIRSCEAYPIHFKVIGRIDDQYRDAVAAFGSDQVSVTGAYEQHAIGGLLAGCDVSLHLSTWPETFVIALTEAWQAGLVPIVADIGALAERVEDGIDGFKVPTDDAGAVRARLIGLHYDRARLDRMRALIGRKSFPDVDSHHVSVRVLYERLIEARPLRHGRVPSHLRHGFDLRLETLGLRTNAASWSSAAIQWDEATHPPAAPTAAAGARARPVPEPPDELRRLTSRPIRRSECGWSLDVLRTDERLNRSLDLSSVVARASVFLRGWLHVSGPAPKAIYLRLTGRSGTSWVALQNDLRPDVAKWYGEPAAATSGFTGQIDVSGLAFGRHALAIVQVADGCLRILDDVASIFIAPDAEPPVRFVPEPRQLVGGPPHSPILHHSLPDTDDAPQVSPGQLWAAEVAFAGTAPKLGKDTLAVFRGTNGQAWRAPVLKIDERTVRITASVPHIDPGAYTVSLAEPHNRTLRTLATLFRAQVARSE
ncbi:glycosyltransferase [Methylobacterium sp. NMS14P]|uniref:glycosyltransferase family protein n=1 Tax=Methylobacterium sp. NMS14P TaxID=2894310 RepID=UPI0023583C17|nr:glycosyltransferase [Methylobacterium sp. NMS14P]WCS25486.1 glycosyltransferase [Methylobacterium sp. NMS14P]